ncbi:IS110 family transposase [Actinomadura coerulea]|uniref:IS110 family transposase n=1 Tax=Actinomadura coerulea TaxID=46159 RepID=UPI003F4D961E
MTTSPWVDEAGQLLAKRRIADSVEGFEELLNLLADVGDDPGDPIPVAIETPRGLLVAALRSTGRKVFAINPMAVARYRERHSVARKKSDHVDAMTLAGILRTDAHAHRPLPDDTELARAIAVLARAHQDAIWRRTRASNALRSLLREYFPAFLAAFAGDRSTNLAGRNARAVLALAFGPSAAARLSRTRIAAALRRAVGNVALTCWPGGSSRPCRGRTCINHRCSRTRWASGPRAAGRPGRRVRQRRPARRGGRGGLRPVTAAMECSPLAAI